MKNLSELGIFVPEILLPKKIDLKSWSVIACDQYTQNLDYWKKAESAAGKNPSTINLILPEIYLNDENKSERIKKIQNTMKEYLANDIFDEPINSYIYVERKTPFGRTRHGFVCMIDLETYEWKPFSKSNIRATEATIVERIPPRMEIRTGAALESPHIMLLVNDKNNLLMKACKECSDSTPPIYSGEFMMNGGEISGWKISENEKIQNAINQIAAENLQEDGSTFLFAVGDGNHSLATAKAVWDEYKKSENLKTDDDFKLTNVRFALVEIVNIYDTGLTFEPIHRVIFNADPQKLISFLCDKFMTTQTEISSKEELEEKVKNSNASFGFAFTKNNQHKFILLETKITELAVSRLQPALDEFISTENSNDENVNKIQIDYIHGSDETLGLGEKENAIGILLPPIAKESFFETIGKTGPLPRKSFSMGEADEKRFYLECRKLFA